MKKLLIATTALAAAGFAAPVAAAEWETRINGYYFLGLAASDNSGQDGIGVLRDGEAHVNAKLITDNGITFKARIELEAFTSGDQIDENWASASSSLGTILIGANDDAVYNNHVGIIFAPGTRVGYYDAFSITTQGDSAMSFAGIGSDQVGIQYTSPSFSGFKVYGSYHPSQTSDGAGDTNNPVFENNDYWTVGASYNADYGDFGVGLSAGYTDGHATGDLITLGATVSTGGFSLAGTYENTDTVGGDRDEYSIGAQYTTGPWTIGGGFADEQTVGEVAAGWVTYGVAPGVLLTAGVEYGDANGVAGSDFGGITYLTMRF